METDFLLRDNKVSVWKCGSVENKDIQINTHKVNTLHVVLTPLLNMLGKQLPAFYGAPQGTLEKKNRSAFA